MTATRLAQAHIESLVWSGNIDPSVASQLALETAIMVEANEQAGRDLVKAKELLSAASSELKFAPCTCVPLYDDQPDGPVFGPPCGRCKVLEQIRTTLEE